MKKVLMLMLTLTLTLLLPAAGALGENRSAALRERVDGMWDIWAGSWSRTFLDGEIYLPQQWNDYPFVTWADEAPMPRVREENGKAEITFGETIGEDWRVCLGKDLPVVYSDCIFDPEDGCWRGEGDFETVYLISDMTDTRIGISVAYQRADDFRPSCPVLEWGREDEEEVLGFNCYGWGTTRSFQGGMYAIVSAQEAYYAEYDHDGALTAWYDAVTGCKYDWLDHLIEGEEPEGYILKVVH